MQTTVVHVREPYDIYIGRAMPRQRLKASKWANPYKVGRDGSRDAVLAAYLRHLQESPELLAAIPELQGKVLGCWCKPAACHGDILAGLVDVLGGGD